ncbi:MAG TPA: DUF1841 family protein [Steroidobacteraceae bacterium]|nr:DUF1841 family protein [Steroidobacteraceae bacterium]
MSESSGYSREQLRQTYVDAWAKARAGAPLTPLEALIADVIALHPEYRAVVEDGESAIAFDQRSDGALENPFLHMGLHIAVREQLAIDRPPGVRELHRLALAKLDGAHRAEHLLIEALGRTLWEAQRDGVAPDERRYLARAREALGR